MGKMVKNTAFLFIKPHAVTDKTKELVKETLAAKGITISSEGSIDAEQIDANMLIDKHYYSIAVKATLKKPSEMPVPKDKFMGQFGVEFDAMVKDGKAFNAKDACEELGVDSAKLDELWAVAKKENKLVKFGGGFYCGEISHDGKTLYVFNGFFMAMRAKFVTPGTSIYYYVVDFDPQSMSWEDFRGKALGPTDPATAPADSLRGLIAAKWKELGMKEPCNVGDNGVHASASPFEALAERMNWLGARVDRDPFGKLLLKAGVSRGLIKDWSNDPQVTFGGSPITKSLFDSLEDTDSDYCAALCQMIAYFAGGAVAKKPSPLEAEVARLKEQVAAVEEMAAAVNIILSFKPPDVGKAKGKGKGESKGKGKGEGKGAEPEPNAKAKAKAKAKSKAEEIPKSEPTPEKKALLTKMAEIREMRNTLKNDGKSKEEADEAVAPLLEELTELKAKAKSAKGGTDEEE